jgi:hypothetical protein
VTIKQNRNSILKNVSTILKADISQVKFLNLKYYTSQNSSKWFSTLGKRSWKQIWKFILHFSLPTMEVYNNSFCECVGEQELKILRNSYRDKIKKLIFQILSL